MTTLKLVTALTVACCFAATVRAQERAARDPLDAKVIFDAGAFFMSTDTRVRLDAQDTGTSGTDFDYDNTFALGDFDRFRAEVLWRIADRHVLRAMYFSNDRSGTQTLGSDVRFGEQTFPAGADVRARSDLTVGQLSYDYAFLRRETWELAGGIGVHVMDIGLKLDGTVTNAGGPQTLAESTTTTAPLPVLALRGVWRLSDSFYITGQAQYFYLKVDPYKGSLRDLKATVVWQPTNHFGVGAGYNDFGFSFDIDNKGDFSGRLRWDYGGALAFVTFMF